MRRGDLVKSTKTTRAGIRCRSFRLVGLLLDDPIAPPYGDFPKKYRVLTVEGVEKIILDQHRVVIEAVDD